MSPVCGRDVEFQTGVLVSWSLSPQGSTVTIIIVFFSITNIALGYGLAIYLGRAQNPAGPILVQSSIESSMKDEAASNDNDNAVETTQQNEDPQVEENSEAKAVSEPAAELSEEVANVEAQPEQGVLDNVVTIQEELQEQSQRDLTPAEPITDERPSTSETIEADSEPEQAPTESNPVSEEQLMQGIGEFQNQLKSQQVQSKLHAVSSSSNDPS